jgi:SAM-dependent methyltransferase
MEAAAQVTRPPERDIYQKLWENPAYRKVAPGEYCVREFLMQARPLVGSNIIDLGCGTGRASLLLAMPPPAGGSFKVTMVDFTDNCLDSDIKDMLSTQQDYLKFVQADLTYALPFKAAYGFCTDVLEHIPPEDVDAVLNNCLASCAHVFFQIATQPDVMGGLVGHPLHLTVQPYEWWLQKFQDRKCVVHWSREDAGSCMFYVTAWMDGKEIQKTGELNIADKIARDNVKFNTSQGWMQVTPHETTLQEVMILGGGPSLNQFEEEIKRRRVVDGVKLITLNGAYNWCLERGLVPSATIIVDARAFNARFTKPVVDGCKYLICSQCDPSVLEGLPKDSTYLWHTSAEANKDTLDAAYDKKWWWIPGGSTVLLRAIPLLRLLGFKRFHLYGCDSCVTEAEHHAYSQPENDRERLFPTTVSCGPRIFMTTIWQASQANEFADMLRFLGDEVELQIYGDGLLAYIQRMNAELDEDE